MNFRITEKLVLLAESPQDAAHQAAINALKFLDVAHRLGRHFVSVETIGLFDRISRLNIDADSLLSLKASYIFDKQICQSFKWHAEFVDEAESYKDEINFVIYVSLSDIPKFEVYSETYVIGENLKDVQFFEYILSYYKDTHGYDIESSFHKLLGGGSTTSVVFDQEQSSRQSFVVCISDSDYLFDGSSLGDTAKKIQSVFRPKNGRYSPFTNYYHYLLVGEVENLIPISLLQRYSSDKSKGLSENFNDVERMRAANPKSFNYFDFKSGITLRTFDKAGYNQVYYDWVMPIKPEIMKKVRDDSARVEKESAGDAYKRKEEMKKIVYVKGFGDKILDNLLSTLGGSVVEEMKKSATEDQIKEYEKIGELLYNWCCRRPMTRV